MFLLPKEDPPLWVCSSPEGGGSLESDSSPKGGASPEGGDQQLVAFARNPAARPEATMSNGLNGDLILLTHAFTCTAHKIYRLLHSTGLVLKYTNTRIHLDTIQSDTYCTRSVSMHARTQP